MKDIQESSIVRYASTRNNKLPAVEVHRPSLCSVIPEISKSVVRTETFFLA
jgi:hypothetical protein